MSFKVTAEWIHTHKSGAGGWTKKQLAVIGVQWPPLNEWVARAVGKIISLEDKKRFEFKEDLFAEPKPGLHHCPKCGLLYHGKKLQHNEQCAACDCGYIAEEHRLEFQEQDEHLRSIGRSE